MRKDCGDAAKTVRKDCGDAAKTVRKDYGVVTMRKRRAERLRICCGNGAERLREQCGQNAVQLRSRCGRDVAYLCETKIRNGKPGFEASGSLVSRVSLPAREILAPPIKRNEYAQTHDCAASLDCVLK